MKLPITLIFLCLLSSACGTKEKNATAIIPAPSIVETSSGDAFQLLDNTKIVISDPQDAELEFIAEQLREFVKLEVGLDVTLSTVADKDTSVGFIHINLDEKFDDSYEYSLEVNDKKIVVTANNHQGLFYGMQSLKQLMLTRNELGISPVTLQDKARFEYRGMLLDVSRHFFPKEGVKRFIDLMAMYKLNTLHWHLTDDQGWRIEIKQYPLLTDIGSYRVETQKAKHVDPFIGDGIAHQGFYNQDDIREIVAYAKARYITIIPEIDMPGHMQAALAAYPHLACTNGPFSVSTRWGIHSDILCPYDETFRFIENVLTEVMSLFPSRYIHIGGDEVPLIRWQQSEDAKQVMLNNNLESVEELHGYFYQRVADFLKVNDREAIGWDEIQDKGITANTTIMAWQSEERSRMAIQNGNQTIIALRESTYFNYYQGNHDSEPLAQCCLITLKDAYNFDPMPEGLSIEQKTLVLGAQGNMWTEYISTQAYLEYMLMPRMLAFSETVWSKSDSKNWSSFEERLSVHFPLLDKLDVNYKK
tara:strand:- start:4766 stop:6358 length:1593 start_codon:yes stop_codon:yes gene_type:complete